MLVMLVLKSHLFYNRVMAIKESNKNLNITVPQEIYDLIAKTAKKECRSISKQGFLYLLKGLELSEKKRSE